MFCIHGGMETHEGRNEETGIDSSALTEEIHDV